MSLRDEMDVAEDVAETLAEARLFRRVTEPTDHVGYGSQPWHGAAHLYVETDPMGSEDRAEYVIAVYRI